MSSNTEIERKFLVEGTDWQSATPTYYCQGYLNRDKHRTVRVRVAGEQGFLTVKGLTTGASRAEFEYTIPLEDAKALLALCEGPLVEKLRHIVKHAGLRWEVDAFLGDNDGLVVAEIELESEAQEIALPEWVGAEITGDARYYNSNLATEPYSTWKNTLS
nr:CYTH domain-containing protein [Armatimonas sp.]